MEQVTLLDSIKETFTKRELENDFDSWVKDYNYEAFTKKYSFMYYTVGVHEKQLADCTATLFELRMLFNAGRLILAPEGQRGVVWTKKERKNYLKNLKKGKANKIFLWRLVFLQDGHWYIEVYDGGNRGDALRAYLFEGENSDLDINRDEKFDIKLMVDHTKDEALEFFQVWNMMKVLFRGERINGVRKGLALTMNKYIYEPDRKSLFEMENGRYKYIAFDDKRFGLLDTVVTLIDDIDANRRPMGDDETRNINGLISDLQDDILNVNGIGYKTAMRIFRRLKTICSKLEIQIKSHPEFKFLLRVMHWMIQNKIEISDFDLFQKKFLSEIYYVMDSSQNKKKTERVRLYARYTAGSAGRIQQAINEFWEPKWLEALESYGLRQE